MQDMPRKTWMEVIRNDKKCLSVNSEDARNRNLRRKIIGGGEQVNQDDP